MAKRAGGLRAELGGEAIYAWLIGDHLRNIKLASLNVQDGGRSYHAAVNEFLSFVAGDIGYYVPAQSRPTCKACGGSGHEPGAGPRPNPDSWEAWQRTAFLDSEGRPLLPGARLTKNHRRLEVGRAVAILRKKGVLGYERKPFSNDVRRILDLVGKNLDEGEPVMDVPDDEAEEHP
jgi:hypothetical protein